MRFKRMARSEFTDTRRKRLALGRKQRREREGLPLLAALIAEQQPDADTVMAQRAARWVEIEQAWRDRRAAAWRRARARLARYDRVMRAAILAYWNSSTMPGDPSYLLDTMHAIDTGFLRPDPLRGFASRPLPPRSILQVDHDGERSALQTPGLPING